MTSKELEQELDITREREAVARSINEYERIKMLLAETGKLSKKETQRIAFEICASNDTFIRPWRVR